MNEIESYIRKQAIAQGFDPDVVMRIVMGEGGVTDPANRSRGYDASLGGQEQSYGPFQLNMHAGLGKRLLDEQGVDVRDPANVYKGIDYALQRAGVEGWTPWLNTMNKLGIGKWTGIRTPATATAAAGDVGGLARGSIMAAQKKGDTAQPNRPGAVAGAGGGQYQLPQGKPQKTAGEKVGDALKGLGTDFGKDLGMGEAPGIQASQFSGGEMMPSVMRPQFQPTQAPMPGMGGGGGGGMDLRALLAQMMGGQQRGNV